MKILFLTSGRRVPSSRFRILPYVPSLRRLGHECVVAPSRPDKYASYRWLGGHRPSSVLRRGLRYLDLLRTKMGRYDVVVLERELFSDDSFDLERRFRRAARTLVLDLDDGIFLQHPAKFEAVVPLCDRVIAGNRLLAEKVAPLNPRVTIIPTCIDLDRYPVKADVAEQAEKPKNSPVLLGWTGMADNLKYLRLIREPLIELAREHRYRLRIIAESDHPLKDLDLRGVDVEFVPWKEASEIEDLARFEIGLMPLRDTEWERYKCGLKILQSMALGIPAVASPVGVNREIIAHSENGYLAENNQQWFEVLSRLIRSHEERREIGLAGRRTVEEHYSIQANVPRFIAALEAAAKQTPACS